jgi:hypothetical protein
MARFLTTIPNNLGFYNLGTVESYPTGGAGPTAYGPTTYFGSDPLPARGGDNLSDPIDLGSFNSIFRTVEITDTHGGLTRKVTTFYRIHLTKPRFIQFTQLQSQFAYEEKTNKNTLISFYRIDADKRREELPINDQGYVYDESAVDYLDDDGTQSIPDYPTKRLNPGEYIFLITNDFRYLKTTYSIGINVSVLDWGKIRESVDESLDFKLITEPVEDTLDFGSLLVV